MVTAWSMGGQVDTLAELEALEPTPDGTGELGELERAQAEACRTAAALLITAGVIGDAPWMVTVNGHTVGPLTVQVASKPMRTDPTG